MGRSGGPGYRIETVYRAYYDSLIYSVIMTLLESSRHGVHLPHQRHIVPEGSERLRRQLAKYELRLRIARAAALSLSGRLVSGAILMLSCLVRPWLRAVEPVSGELVWVEMLLGGGHCESDAVEGQRRRR